MASPGQILSKYHQRIPRKHNFMVTIWQLNPKSGKRFIQGHPWVFSNELSSSPKGVTAGELIELRSAQNEFLALGFGHPNSLISFRTLSRKNATSCDEDFYYKKLEECLRLRINSVAGHYSFRLSFGDIDYLPGLIIDVFKTKKSGVIVLQSQSASGDILCDKIYPALKKLVDQYKDFFGFLASDMTVLIKRDSSKRALDGLNQEDSVILQSGCDADNLKTCPVLLQAGSSQITLYANLISGQKTGLFLDQRHNIALLLHFMQNHQFRRDRPVKILDLFCHVGQWSLHLANALKKLGYSVDVTLADASEEALSLASLSFKEILEKNDSLTIKKEDLFKTLDSYNSQGFDIVVCDPPALIKKRGDMNTGLKGYEKINRLALGVTRLNGLFVTCSCSGLVKENDFDIILANASSRTQMLMLTLATGGHAFDHPTSPHFPEGQYLKCRIAKLRLLSS